jgi:hypothetical protein
MASLFTMSDGDLKASIDGLLSGVPDLKDPQGSEGTLAMATIYQNELNRRLLEKILKTQTDDE